ncbi:hypothetical protein [Rhizobium favelukesii]|uniref:hypothetical protein n=1 Tax=Rhizobium favelukesii TaxID=348824 RepID=UPI00215E72F7|nr:hypothetical protein [Rhizobium favelukesii]MCS0459553.1 hypothetical protein [Rhizobium favelukesii]
MSSEKLTRFLTSDDLNVIQKILTDAGYSGHVWETTPPNAAAKLLIRLFQEGMTEPADLVRELQRRLGSHSSPSPEYKSPPHQFATRPVPSERQRQVDIQSPETNKAAIPAR